MRNFFDYNWWKDATVATAGTIIGIIVTFGTTDYIENKNQQSMADKTVTLTLHNLDSSIENMENLIEEMRQNDSIYVRALSLMPDSIGVMGVDSLHMIVNRFGSRRLYMTDNSTREIFSSSFEVWQYLDDAKVIGRIGNCYSILNSCSKEYDRIEALRLDAFKSYWNECAPNDYQTEEMAVRSFLRRNDVRYAMEVHHSALPLLTYLIDVAHKLNDRNKQILGITQEKLDEVGNLLDKNEYHNSSSEGMNSQKE